MPVVIQSQKRKKWLAIGMQRQSAVRLMAVQEDRDARDRDVGERQRDADVAPEREIQQTVDHIQMHPPVRRLSPYRRYRKALKQARGRAPYRFCCS